MGDVIKAKDLKLNRMVALKFLRPDQSGDPARRQRFMQEAQAASALNHPNIITIHDVITEDGTEIMVMEMVAGQSLDSLIPRGGLRVSKIISYAAQVADALAAAHGAGIIHRDLKPGNIMVTERDLVKLLDFGLAKLAPGAFGDDPDATNLLPLTVQGTIVGTLSYMSPEQAQGKPSDARSDIFSFGAVLYEMATGNRAFTGDNSISTLTSVLRDEPRRVLEISPDVPEVLSEMIHRCLQKDPDARFQSMGEVRDALIRLRQLSESGVLFAQSPQASGIFTAPASSANARAEAPTVAMASPIITPAAATTKAATPATPATAVAAPASSKTGMLAVAALAVIGLGAAGWWFSARTAQTDAPQPQLAAATPTPIATPEPPAATPAPTPAAAAAQVAPSNTTAKPAPRPAAPATTPAARPAASAAPATVLLVPVRDAMPIALELLTEIPVGAETGMPLQFVVAADVVVAGERVIAKGATATGEIYVQDGKRQVLGGGNKVTIQLKQVAALDGTQLNIRALASPGPDSRRTLEASGQKPKTIIVPKGATTIGYVSGEQAVRLKK